MAITATTTTASTIRITIGFLLRAGPPGARRAARLNAVEMALVAGVGGVGNLKGKGGGNIDVLFAVPAVPAQLRGRPMTPDRRTGRAPRPALDEHGIAELVRAVPTGLQLPVGPAERGLVRERAQQFVMAAAGFMRDAPRRRRRRLPWRSASLVREPRHRDRRRLQRGAVGPGFLSRPYAGAQRSGTPKSAATIQVVKPTKSGIVRLSSMRSGSSSQPAAASAIVPAAPAIASPGASAPRPSTRAAITSVATQKASEPSRVRLRAMRRRP